MTAATDVELDAQLAAYVDGDLNEAERAELESELDDDSLQEIAGLRKMLDLVAALPEVDAPPDFYDQLRRRMRRRRSSDDGWLSGLVALPFQVLSIVIILAVATIFLMTELDRDRATIERDPDAAAATSGSEAGAENRGDSEASDPAP